MHKDVQRALDQEMPDVDKIVSMVCDGVVKKTFWSTTTSPARILQFRLTEGVDTFFHIAARKGILSQILPDILDRIEDVYKLEYPNFDKSKGHKTGLALIFLMRPNAKGDTPIKLAYAVGDAVNLDKILSEPSLRLERDSILMDVMEGANAHLETLATLAQDGTTTFIERKTAALASEAFTQSFDIARFLFADNWERILSMGPGISKETGTSNVLNVLSKFHRILRVLEVHDNEYWGLNREEICRLLDFGLVEVPEGRRAEIPNLAEDGKILEARLMPRSMDRDHFRESLKQHILDQLAHHYLIDRFATLKLGDIFPALKEVALMEDILKVDGAETYEEVPEKLVNFVLKGSYPNEGANPDESTPEEVIEQDAACVADVVEEVDTVRHQGYGCRQRACWVRKNYTIYHQAIQNHAIYR